ncbi:hypothetical protein R6Q59_019879 [Mikania micrantha]
MMIQVLVAPPRHEDLPCAKARAAQARAKASSARAGAREKRSHRLHHQAQFRQFPSPIFILIPATTNTSSGALFSFIHNKLLTGNVSWRLLFHLATSPVGCFIRRSSDLLASYPAKPFGASLATPSSAKLFNRRVPLPPSDDPLATPLYHPRNSSMNHHLRHQGQEENHHCSRVVG